MKRFVLFSLMSVGIAWYLLAGNQQLDRSQLKSCPVAKSQDFQVATTNGKGMPVSLQQVMRERHLTLDDNKINSNAPRLHSLSELSGVRIASVGVYDFDWDAENSVANVIDSSCVYTGEACMIKYKEDNTVLLKDFFGSYDIPLIIDETTGKVTLQAGVSLGWIANYSTPLYKSSLPTYWRLFAVQLSWLEGGDENNDIHGQLHEDGSIEFIDDFAFLVEKHVIDNNHNEEISWGLSPIFKHLILLVPNGRHSYEYHDYVFNLTDAFEEDEHGHGGIVPRPVRPGNTKPVNPRSMNSIIGSSNPATVDCEDNDYTKLSGGNRSNYHYDVYDVIKPVYMYEVDDTTLHVLNLFGLGGSCYMKIYPNNTMSFPAQMVSPNRYCSGFSGQVTVNGIEWSETRFGLMVDFYLNNLLYYYDEAFPVRDWLPYFVEPELLDSTMVIGAESTAPYGVVMVTVYDEETGDYIRVSNPCTFPRLEEPYMIHLAAVIYYDDIDYFSEEVFQDYLVPAKLSSGVLGDVNNDGFVSIGDVTTLIDHLLNNTYVESADFSPANADLNGDNKISIGDVTILIEWLLDNNHN